MSNLSGILQLWNNQESDGVKKSKLVWCKIIWELDEWTACWQLKSLRSLSGRSIHLTLVTKWSWSWSMNLTMKIHGQGDVCGQRSWSCLTFKIQRSRLWSRSKPLVTFEAWNLIDMFAFRFVAIGPLFGRDISNSIFDLEKSKSRSQRKSTKI